MPRLTRTIDTLITRLLPAAIRVRRAIVGGIAVACWLCICVPALAERKGTPNESKPSAASKTAKEPSRDDIDRWVRELSHDSYPVRQEATARLLAAGMPAREPLMHVADGPDPETRAAARRLVSLIDRTEFQRRLEAFAADTDGREKLTLPGWEEFRKIAGDDAAARALFVDMQRQEGATISAVFGASKRPREELWEARLMRLTQWRATASERGATPPLGSCAAMLFLGSVAEMNVSDTAAALTESIVESPQIRETLQGEKAQDAMRKLVIGWLVNCPNKNEDLLRRRLSMIAAAGLSQALPLALGVIGGDPQYLRVQPLAKAEAASIIGKLGKREHVARLEPLLEDATVCLQSPTPIPGQPAQTVQVRDVALVAMLQLSAQNPAEYGYLGARQQPTGTFQMQTLFRANDEERTKAIAKWREWWVVHKDDKPAESAAKAKPPIEKPAESEVEPTRQQ